MPCERVKLDNGVTAIVCTPKQRERKCSVCHGRSSRLCDHPKPGGGTCDKPLCTRCAVMEGDEDFCPSHDRRQAALAL